MKAVVLHQHGGPEVLQVEDLPDPEPACGEVPVRNVLAAGAREGGARAARGEGAVREDPAGA
jgi:NADPH2:quinone reductase